MKKAIILLLASAGFTSVFAQEVPRELTIEKPIGTGSQRYWQAHQAIIAYNYVEPGAVTNYTAGQAITLGPGFSAQIGSVFLAEIKAYSTGDDHLESQSAMKPIAYPNPFFEATTIEFMVSKAGEATLVLMDESGAVIRQQTVFKAAGRQQTQLDASNLRRGVYYYQIKTGSETKTIRLLKN